MKELLRTTDPVQLSFVQAVLADAGIHAVVFDANISAVEGSIGIFPRRVMVAEAQLDDALMALHAAGVRP